MIMINSKKLTSYQKYKKNQKENMGDNDINIVFHVKMSYKVILKFSKICIEKRRFYSWKNPVDLDKVDVGCISVSNKYRIGKNVLGLAIWITEMIALFPCASLHLN